MMKHLLFTSAIALFSVVTFAQNGTYPGQRNGQKPQSATTTKQSGYNQNRNSQTANNQQVVQQSNNNYTPNNQSNYNNQPQNNQPQNNNYTQNQPYNSNGQGRGYNNYQAPQKQGQRTREQDEYNRRYAPVYHQMQYRSGFRRDQYRGHGYYDQHGNFCY